MHSYIHPHQTDVPYHIKYLGLLQADFRPVQLSVAQVCFNCGNSSFSCQGSVARNPSTDALEEILGAACGNQTNSEKENSG